MNVVIIENEIQNARYLSALLRLEFPDTHIDAVLTSIEEIRQYFQGHAEPDLLFADIRLDDGDCIETLQQMQIKAPIIFTTAYDGYVMEAFHMNSFDYLLKPIVRDELRNAVLKVKRYCSLSNSKVYVDSLTYEFRDQIKKLEVRKVDFFHTSNKVVRFYVQGRSAILSKSLDELENMLNPSHFFRANRQYLVNRKAIKALTRMDGSKLRVLLTDYANLEVVVSKEKARAMKEWFSQNQ